MRNILVAACLLCLQASADTKILIEKASQQYVVIPDCYIPPDAEVTIKRLRRGASVYLNDGQKRVRCEIEDFYQLKS